MKELSNFQFEMITSLSLIAVCIYSINRWRSNIITSNKKSSKKIAKNKKKSKIKNMNANERIAVERKILVSSG